MIQTQGITKSFGNLQVLKGIDLTINKSEVVAIVGPSGAGLSVRWIHRITDNCSSTGPKPANYLKKNWLLSAIRISVLFFSSISYYRSSRHWKMS